MRHKNIKLEIALCGRIGEQAAVLITSFEV